MPSKSVCLNTSNNGSPKAGNLLSPTRIEVWSRANSMNQQESAGKVASGFRIIRQQSYLNHQRERTDMCRKHNQRKKRQAHLAKRMCKHPKSRRGYVWRYDAIYCKRCGRWLEPACSDPTCEWECTTRPKYYFHPDVRNEWMLTRDLREAFGGR